MFLLISLDMYQCAFVGLKKKKDRSSHTVSRDNVIMLYSTTPEAIETNRRGVIVSLQSRRTYTNTEGLRERERVKSKYHILMT